MRARGDWILPTFNGRMRPDKPPLSYWAMWLAYEVFGDGAFGARAAQGVSGALAVLLTFLLGIRVAAALGRRGAAALVVGTTAAAILAVSPQMVVEGKAATADAFLLFSVTLAHLALLRSGEGARGWWAVFWVACALGTLAKGLPGLLPLGTLAFVRVAVRRSAASPRWRLNWGRGVLLLFALTLPWAVAVSLRTEGEFLRAALGVHHLQRALHPMEGHGGPIVYYLLVIPAGFLPGIVPLLFGPWKHRATGEERAWIPWLLWGWALIPVLVFSPLATKLPHYVLPSYPALAVLSVLAWQVRRRPRAQAVAQALLHLGAAALVVWGVPRALETMAGARLPEAVAGGFRSAGLFLLLPTVVGALSLLRQWRWAQGVLALAWVPFWLFLALRALPALEPYRAFPELGRRVAASGAQVVLSPWTPEPSLVYYGRARWERARDSQEVLERVRIHAGALGLLAEGEWKSAAEAAGDGLAVRARVEGWNPATGKWGRWVLVGRGP
jgi:4-amino-4-deoxy-L-arabinose transferase-like glycosyltransferase